MLWDNLFVVFVVVVLRNFRITKKMAKIYQNIQEYRSANQVIFLQSTTTEIFLKWHIYSHKLEAAILNSWACIWYSWLNRIFNRPMQSHVYWKFIESLYNRYICFAVLHVGHSYDFYKLT